MELSVRLPAERGHRAHPESFPWRATRFFAGSFLASVVLLAAGVGFASVPTLVVLGVVLLICALELAFLMPFLWNRIFRTQRA